MIEDMVSTIDTCLPVGLKVLAVISNRNKPSYAVHYNLLETLKNIKGLFTFLGNISF